VVREEKAEDLENLLSLLHAQRESVKTKVSSLKAEIKDISDKLDTAFIQQKECPYHLHAIIVHDGQDAVSGHYYSFVHDKSSEIWWRFNDHSVSQETEEIVMQEAIGGFNQKCAYSLMYVKGVIAEQLQKTPFTSYCKSETFP